MKKNKMFLNKLKIDFGLKMLCFSRAPEVVQMTGKRNLRNPAQPRAVEANPANQVQTHKAVESVYTTVLLE